MGVTLRNLMLRFGEATTALTTVQARLAVTEAVGAERARLARELHDSVAKTLHGVALAADGLVYSAGADHMNPTLIRQQAELVARSARRAAAESRELLADLRRESNPAEGTDVLVELAARTRDFSTRTGLPTTYRPTGEHGVPPVPPAVARQLLTIATEAMENAHRHATPPRSTSRRGSTTASSASACTTTAAASPRARPSNSCAGRATSAWSAWSSGRHRWVRVSVSAGAVTTRARRSAWNFRWAP